jgi:chemotaxis protein histidine kinase CheA
MDDWDITLAGLRVAFLERAPALADDAADALGRLIDDSTSRDALESLRLALHKLVGSAGTYGFTVIAAAASDAEGMCRMILDSSSTPSANDLEHWRGAIERIRAAVTESSERGNVACTRTHLPATSSTPSST